MAEELINGNEPIEVEETTKVLIGLRHKEEDSCVALTIEQYSDIDKSLYDLEGIVIRNEDEDLNLLFSVTESQATFGEGPADIPETDKRRKNAPSNPQFCELDGYMRTQWQLNNHPDTHEEGCAICEAVKFGWLPSNGEMAWLVEKMDEFNEAAEVCGADKLSSDSYWCSTQYSPDYMWCYDAQAKSFIFWKSKATEMAIRPVKSASEYVEFLTEE